MNKSFKGLLANDTVTQIRLSTNNGLIGYKIVKFELIPADPSGNSGTNIAQVFTSKTDATGVTRTASTVIDFNDPTLIAACVDGHNASAFQYDPNPTIIIDNAVVNQDVFITHKDPDGNATSTNFYLELEQVKLSKDEATMATLKDMRAGPPSFA